MTESSSIYPLASVSDDIYGVYSGNSLDASGATVTMKDVNTDNTVATVSPQLVSVGSGNNNALQIQPVVALTAGDSYSVSVSGLKDSSGKAIGAQTFYLKAPAAAAVSTGVLTNIQQTQAGSNVIPAKYLFAVTSVPGATGSQNYSVSDGTSTYTGVVNFRATDTKSVAASDIANALNSNSSFSSRWIASSDSSGHVIITQVTPGSTTGVIWGVTLSTPSTGLTVATKETNGVTGSTIGSVVYTLSGPVTNGGTLQVHFFDGLLAEDVYVDVSQGETVAEVTQAIATAFETDYKSSFYNVTDNTNAGTVTIAQSSAYNNASLTGYGTDRFSNTGVGTVSPTQSYAAAKNETSQITVTAPPLHAGTLTVKVDNELVTVNVGTSDSVSVVATRIAAALNQDSNITNTYTVTSSGAVVTIENTVAGIATQPTITVTG